MNVEPFYKHGKTISIRLPKDTPEEVLDRLNELKDTFGKGFSRKLADLLFDAVLNDIDMSDNAYLPLPGKLTEDQKQMLNTPMQRRVLGHVVYQMITQDTPLTLENQEQTKSNKDDTSFKTSNVHNKFASNLFDMDND